MNTLTFEQILNSIERNDNRVIPGTLVTEGQKVIYFQDNNVNSINEQFDNLISFNPKPNAMSGGAVIGGGCITLPSGIKYHAIILHGDIEGWQQDILIGSEALNLSIAEIKDENIVLENGSIYSLDQCNIDFY